MMAKTRLNKSLNKWQKAYPSLNLPVNILQDKTPIYYIQVGNVLHIRIRDNSYIIEINQEPPKPKKTKKDEI